MRYKHGNRETDFITYVNAVEKDGAAHQAGLREGLPFAIFNIKLYIIT